MRKLILRALQQERYVSGEQLGRRLNISRTAVWKHVNELRKKGYKITSSPRLGYSFVKSTDRLLPEEISLGLNTHLIGKHILYREEVTSTQNVAGELAQQGVEEGTVVIAERQTEGRGRKGRGWASPANEGIYLSIILRPNLRPIQVLQIPLIAGVAISRAIKRLTTLQPRIKWPNDIIIGGKKVGGILIETDRNREGERCAVVGFGLNLTHAPDDTVYSATSLRSAGSGDIAATALLSPLCRGFDGWYRRWAAEGFGPVREAWLDRAAGIGTEIEARLPAETLSGVFRGIDQTGALVLARDDGVERLIPAADVFLPVA